MTFSAANTIWVLLGAALVFFMQAGFAMCEAGFTRAKNTGNILMKNLMDFCIGTPLYWLLGYGIMFGAGTALFGWIDPFIMKDYSHILPAGVPLWAFAIFQTVYQILRLLHLFRGDLAVHLPGLRSLDLGRRLAGGNGLP